MNLTSERAALDVMKRHIDALNALDENSLVGTLHFLLSSSRPKVTCIGQKKELPCRFTKGLAIKWALSKWDTIDVQESSLSTKFIYLSKLFVSTITKMSLQGSSHYG